MQNTKFSSGNLGVYNALVSNNNEVFMAYLFVNWDDTNYNQYVGIDPVADGLAKDDTNWCTYVYENGDRVG